MRLMGFRACSFAAALLPLAAAPVSTQTKPVEKCSDVTYERGRGQVAPTLVASRVEGSIRDDIGPMEGAEVCVGVFSVKYGERGVFGAVEAKRVAFAVSDAKSRFTVPRVPDGDYEVVVTSQEDRRSKI